MQTVARWVEPAKLQARASVEDYKEGQQIVAAKGVMLELTNPLKITAKVTVPGGTVRHTELASMPDGLYWNCSCNDEHVFCAHLVATALIAGQKVPQHHRNRSADDQAGV